MVLNDIIEQAAGHHSRASDHGGNKRFKRFLHFFLMFQIWSIELNLLMKIGIKFGLIFLIWKKMSQKCPKNVKKCSKLCSFCFFLISHQISINDVSLKLRKRPFNDLKVTLILKGRINCKSLKVHSVFDRHIGTLFSKVWLKHGVINENS